MRHADWVGIALGALAVGYALWGVHSGSTELYLGRVGRWPWNRTRLAMTFDRHESPIGFWGTTAAHVGVGLLLVMLSLSRKG